MAIWLGVLCSAQCYCQQVVTAIPDEVSYLNTLEIHSEIHKRLRGCEIKNVCIDEVTGEKCKIGV